MVRYKYFFDKQYKRTSIDTILSYYFLIIMTSDLP